VYRQETIKTTVPLPDGGARKCTGVDDKAYVRSYALASGAVGRQWIFHL